MKDKILFWIDANLVQLFIAKIMKERFNVSNPKALLCRFHTQTAGSSLQAQQIDNNIIRLIKDKNPCSSIFPEKCAIFTGPPKSSIDPLPIII